jgi:hypothetical protein
VRERERERDRERERERERESAHTAGASYFRSEEGRVRMSAAGPVQQVAEVQGLGALCQGDCCHPAVGVTTVGFVAWLTTNATLIGLQQ